MTLPRFSGWTETASYTAHVALICGAWLGMTFAFVIVPLEIISMGVGR